MEIHIHNVGDRQRWFLGFQSNNMLGLYGSVATTLILTTVYKCVYRLVEGLLQV